MDAGTGAVIRYCSDRSQHRLDGGDLGRGRRPVLRGHGVVPGLRERDRLQHGLDRADRIRRRHLRERRDSPDLVEHDLVQRGDQLQPRRGGEAAASTRTAAPSRFGTTSSRSTTAPRATARGEPAGGSLTRAAATAIRSLYATILRSRTTPQRPKEPVMAAASTSAPRICRFTGTPSTETSRRRRRMPSRDYRRGYGGGICVTSGTAPLERNVIINNTASLHGSGYGGGLLLLLVRSDPTEHLRLQYGLRFRDGHRRRPGRGRMALLRQVGRICEQHVLIATRPRYTPASRDREAASTTTAGALSLSLLREQYHRRPRRGEQRRHRVLLRERHDDIVQLLPRQRGRQLHRERDIHQSGAGRSDACRSRRGDFSLSYNSSCIEEGDPTYAVPENGAWVVDIGAIEYTGTRHWRPVSSTGLLLFGGRVKAKVNVTTLGTLSEIDMVVHPGETYPAEPASVARWYGIDHEGDGDAVRPHAELSRGRAQRPGSKAASACGAGPALHGRAPRATRRGTSRRTGSPWRPRRISAIGSSRTRIRRPASTSRRRRFHLSANYPNPFNPSTTISYELARPSHVRLEVIQRGGPAGEGAGGFPRRARAGTGYEWDGLDGRGAQAASGVYFYRLRAGSSSRPGKWCFCDRPSFSLVDRAFQWVVLSAVARSANVHAPSA